MVQKNVTLFLEQDVYDRYKEFCKQKAIALSRSIEVFMEHKMNGGSK